MIKKSYTKIIFVTSENATYDKFSSINAYIWVKWNGVWISSESLLHNVRDNVWKVSNQISKFKKYRTNALIQLPEKREPSGGGKCIKVTKILPKV